MFVASSGNPGSREAEQRGVLTGCSKSDVDLPRKGIRTTASSQSFMSLLHMRYQITFFQVLKECFGECVEFFEVAGKINKLHHLIGPDLSILVGDVAQLQQVSSCPVQTT